MTSDGKLIRLAAETVHDGLTDDEAACVRRFALIPRAFSRDGRCSAELVAAAAGWPVDKTTALLERLTACGVLDKSAGGYTMRPAFSSVIIERACDADA